MSNYLHTIPITAIVENNNQFLFIRRSRNCKNMAGKWVFPGGKVEKGEDIIQALYRELAEETGLEFTNDIAFLSAYQFLRNEDSSSSQGLVFLVRAKNREIKSDEDIEEYRWINPEDIVNYKFQYQKIKDFGLENNVTIPGMEVHVRNALIIMNRNMFLDKDLFTVTKYQQQKCSMDKKYLEKIIKKNDQESFSKEEIFPNSKI